MRNQEFIASYWTLAGNVVPLGKPEQEASRIELNERLKVAAEEGYSGIGLISSDLNKIRENLSLSEIKAMFEDYGMRYLELEFLVGWLADGDELLQSERVFSGMLEVADQLNVRHIKVGPDMNAKDWPLERMVDRFSRLCERAKSVGTTISLEMMPWSNLKDLESTLSVITTADCQNGGLLLDIWHVARGAVPYSKIPKIPKNIVNYVELNDADKITKGSLLEDTLNNRKFCGEGELDVPEFLRAVLKQGYEGPFGIEIISSTQRLRPFQEVASDAINTAKSEMSKITADISKI